MIVNPFTAGFVIGHALSSRRLEKPQPPPPIQVYTPLTRADRRRLTKLEAARRVRSAQLDAEDRAFALLVVLIVVGLVIGSIVVNGG